MENLFNPPKFAEGTLLGCDGNAFALMAHFRKCARKSDWSKQDIDKVINVAMAGDYNNLICVLDAHLTIDDYEGFDE